MDTSALASAATSLMAATVTGAATAVGAEAAQTVTRLVRERLGGTEEGRASITQFIQEPESTAASETLRAALQDALVADPDFAQQLSAILTNQSLPVALHQTGNAIISQSKLRKTQVSLGPLSITNTRTTRISLSAFAAVLIGLAFALIYSNVTSEAPPSIPLNPTPSIKGHASTSARGEIPPEHPKELTEDPRAPFGVHYSDEEIAEHSLPTTSSMLAGWDLAAGPEVTNRPDDNCDPSRKSCNYSASGVVSYQKHEETICDFMVFSFANSKEAEDAFPEFSEEVAWDNFTPTAMAPFGERSEAFRGTSSDGDVYIFAVARTGNLVAAIFYKTKATEQAILHEEALPEKMMQMLVERCNQALEGQEPSARLTTF